jgi:CBS domain-containing protein
MSKPKDDLSIQGRVSQIMTKKVITVERTRKVVEALNAMLDNEVGCVVVTNEDRPCGIITQSDIARRIVKNSDILNQKVDAVMSEPLVTIAPEAIVVNALDLMQKRNVRRLPVVSDGRLQGIVTVHRDILFWMLSAVNIAKVPARETAHNG